MATHDLHCVAMAIQATDEGNEVMIVLPFALHHQN